MTRRAQQIAASFRNQLASVEALLDFDRFLLDHVVGGLAGLAEGLEGRNRNNEARDVRNRLKTIQNTRDADSLRPRYETMFNQCVVLLVSYFGSTMGDLFRDAVAAAMEHRLEVPAADKAIALTWRSIHRSELQLAELLADGLAEQHKISFQDMQSISRAFADHLSIELPRTETVNDIVLGQAARHVIVHNGAIVDSKMLNQLRVASPRTLKSELTVGERLQFTPDEVKRLGGGMEAYVHHVATAVGTLLASRTD